ncbi:MAG: hypothetical protein PHC53_02345 [Patescibacteria group bacterium]|nr:hypothetical protein [Patescibacteria group bacterium]
MSDWLSNHLELTAIAFVLVMLVLGAAIPIGERISQLKKKEQPKPKRRRTYGREFLLLRDQKIRHQALNLLRSRAGYANTNAFIFGMIVTALAILFLTCNLFLTNSLRYLFAAGAISCSILWFTNLCLPLRFFSQELLLPLYRQRQLAKAKTERDAVTQKIKAKLPQARYRVSATTVEQLREMARERRLPKELVTDVKKLERADQELIEAEADLAASNPQPAEAKTT